MGIVVPTQAVQRYFNYADCLGEKGEEMNKNKITDKLKEGVSVKEIEEFTRKHTIEVFSILAIVIATVSSCWGFFTGPKLTIFFVALGSIIAILFPVHVDRGLKQLYNFVFKQEKTTQMIVGAVKIVVAIFIPFLLFGLLGLLAGSSFHYFVRQAQVLKQNHPNRKGGHSAEPGEHD